MKRPLKIIGPLLRPIVQWYLSVTRWYSYEGLKIKILPGVFHPGLFFNTKVLLLYMRKQNLQNKSVLELGAGTGLLSLYCYKLGASPVVASDISKKAITNIKENASLNSAKISAIESDLFEFIDPNNFHWILITPPYFPTNPNSEDDHAWCCGEHFNYFEKLFAQLNQKLSIDNNTIIIFPEDCDLEKIKSIAARFKYTFKLLYHQKVWGEQNYIYQIVRNVIP